AGLKVVQESEAQLWWAGKELKETKLLSDYIGKNEKTTIIVKIQKVSIAERFLSQLFTFGCAVVFGRELS
ncbi:CF298 protein, partial [Semnornis frantzii]|nr:CF298 protein [Semnornis frantzii]